MSLFYPRQSFVISGLLFVLLASVIAMRLLRNFSCFSISALAFALDYFIAVFAVSAAGAYASGSVVAGGGNFASVCSVSGAFFTAVLTGASTAGSGRDSVSFEDLWA